MKLIKAIVILFLAYLFFILFFVEKKYYTEKVNVPYETKIKKSKFIQNGWKIWIKEGRPGYKNGIKEKTNIFGIIIFQKEIFVSDVLKKPEEAVVILGTSEKKHPIEVPKETFVHYVYNMEATGYDPYPDANQFEWAGLTKLGWRARYGIAAVDPRIIALRSLLYIEGYGFAWAGDTGGAIKGKKIDLCYNTTEEALKWGRRKTKVYVLGKKPISQIKKKD